jgi:hypothetical protein
MHNKCLLNWLIIEDSCPLCRHSIGVTSEDLEPQHTVSVLFLNDISTTSYITITSAIIELISYITNEHDSESIKNKWTTDDCGNFYLKLRTRLQIIDISISCENENTLYVSFNIINKTIQYHQTKKYVSKHSNITRKPLPRIFR